MTVPPFNTDAYTGVRAPTPPNLTRHTRDPLTSDRSGFFIGDIWLNTVGKRLFVLFDNPLSGASWIQLGSTDDILTLTGNTGGAISPDASGNLSVLGGIGINAVGTANTLTINNMSVFCPYIVDSGGTTAYTTIQSAITQAVADGASSTAQKTIYIRGDNGATYAESITLSDGINLVGIGSDCETNAITISGAAGVNTLTLPVSGTASATNLTFSSQAGQDVVVNPTTPTGTINFCSSNCTFDATLSGGNAAFNVDNNGSGQQIIVKSSKTSFKGSTVDFIAGAGVSFTSCNDTRFKGALKALEISGNANISISDFSIGAYSTITASTALFFNGMFAITTGAQDAIQTLTSGTTTIDGCRVSAVGNACINVGTGTTGEILYSSLNATAPATEVLSGSGSITKSGVSLLSVTSVSPTLTFTTPIMI